MREGFSVAGVYVNCNYQFYGELYVGDNDICKIAKKAAVTIYNWAKNKVPDLKMDRNIRSGSLHKHSQKVDIIYNYNESYFCMALEHADTNIPGRTWIIEAEIGIINSRLMLGVKVTYTTPKGRIVDKPNYGVPRFVVTIANNTPIIDVVVLNESYTICDDKGLKGLYDLIVSKDRYYPVVVIAGDSTGRYNGFVLDEVGLKKRVGLIAHVYKIDSTYVEKWNNLVGEEWGVLPNCVRTYNREFSFEDEKLRHPYTGINKIMAASISSEKDGELIAGKAYEYILANMLIANSIKTRIDWKGLGFKFYYFANKEKENDSLQENKNLREVYAKQLQERDKRIEDLENELLTGWDEIDKKNSIIDNYKTIIFNQNNRIDDLQALLNKRDKKDIVTIPNNYGEMEEWISKYYSGRIVLLGRAKRMLKNAEFEDVQLVYKSLQVLAEYYYNMKKGKITLEECNKKCKSIKIEITGAIADSRAGEFGDTYYVDYKDRKMKLDMHVKNSNSRDPKKCMRIYFFWDDEDEYVVIGALPQHLQIRTS